MSMNDPTAIEELLGYQLGLCDEQERWAVEARLHASPQAQRQSVLLQRTLSPLNAYDVRPPASLVSGVMERVARTQSIFEFPARRKVAASDGGSGGGRATMSMRELLSLAAAIVLFVGVFMPGYQAARNSAARTLCLDQMRVVGGGLGSYVEANSGMLPYSSAAALSGPMERAALPRAAGHLQVLQQENYVPGLRVLHCPAAGPGDKPEYNFQLLLIPQSASRFSPFFPIVSDPNPMVVNGRYLPVEALRNADTHGANAGQVVLRLNGAAGWHDRPTVGVDGDDIFRLDQPATYAGEPGRSLSEAFLIP